MTTLPVTEIPVAANTATLAPSPAATSTSLVFPSDTPQADIPTQPTASPTATTEAQFVVTATSDGYPAPPTAAPTNDPYPAQPATPGPTRDPYPGQAVTPSFTPAPQISPTALPSATPLPTAPVLLPSPTLAATAVITTPDITTTLLISMPQIATPFQEARLLTTGSIRHLAFSPGGMQLALATTNGSYLYAAARMELEDIVDPGVLTKQVAYLPEGNLLLTGGLNGDLIWWDLESGRYQGLLDSHRLGVSGLAFDRQGSLLVSGGDDGVVKVWDIAGVRVSGPEVARLLHTQDDFNGRITALALNPSNQILAVGSYRQLQIWDARSGALLQELPGMQDWVSAAVFSPDGRLLVTSDARYRLQFWRVSDWTRSAILMLDGIGALQALAFRPDGQLLASGHTDGGVLLWDPLNASLLGYFQAHTRSVTSLAFNDSGGILATGSTDGWARLWQPGMLLP